ncbi:MAG: phage integrase SAM-like domain-containing protein, partial [Pseudomonadota bacterium]|nr:phage integrase SAM-like domain-containing protein [Pseudomonadota bacterium]
MDRSVTAPAAGEQSSASGLASNRKILTSKSFKDGAIYLFVRGDYQKPIWLCRVKVPGAKGYIYRSTRTTNEHEAFKFADDLYNRTSVKVLSGGNPHAKKIGKAIESYVARFDSQRSRLSVQYKILLLERCKPFLASKAFEELDTTLLSSLMGFLSENSSKGHLSANTIKRIHSDLKHFLHWCVEEGYLDKVPVFPRTSSDNARRPHFDGADSPRTIEECSSHSLRRSLMRPGLIGLAIIALVISGVILWKPWGKASAVTVVSVAS